MFSTHKIEALYMPQTLICIFHEIILYIPVLIIDSILPNLLY